MKKKLICIVLVVFIILLSFISYNSINKNRIKSMYNSLVRIESYDKDVITSGFGFTYKISKNKAYIITNYHVIENYFNIYVYDVNNKKTKAKIVNYDINNDIAILSIDNVLNLKEVVIRNSDNLKKGNSVYILGDPLNTKKFKSIKKGIIVDGIDDIRDIYDFNPLTIESSVEYGSSGSPVLDKNGKIVGMVFLMKKNSKNICLAIPINYIVNFMGENELNEDRPSLGSIMTSSSNIEVLKEYNIEPINIDGVVILKISNESILKKHNLNVGDVITSFNGIKINNIEDLKKELYKLSIGTIVSIEYYSKGAYNTMTLEL